MLAKVLDSSVAEAINSDLLDSTCNNLENLIDNITTDLNNIDMIIYNLDDYYKGDQADELKGKYESYRNKYEVFRGNLSTFVSDLIAVKNGLSDELYRAQVRLEGLTEDTSKEARKEINI